MEDEPLFRRTLTLALFLRCAPALVSHALTPSIAVAQPPAAAAINSQGAAAKGVRCPPDFEASFDPGAMVLRCRRDVVSWVVTSCTEKGFTTYVAKPGADGCTATLVPGVGTPPGSTETRGVTCVSPGYRLMTDRTGPRDRCERVDRTYAFPQPVS